MKKITYLLLMVLLAAMLHAAELESLNVDFGTVGAPVQSGYEAYTGTDKDLASFTTQPYNVFGTTLNVTASWEGTAVASVARMVNRGAQSYEDATEPLMQDWIGSDTQYVGDPLTLTISGLPAGQYTFVSYHHDTGTTAPVGIIDITVNDAAGSVTTLGFQETNSSVTTFEDVAKFEATITSNGVDDVTVVYDNQNPDGNVAWNQKYFFMNGFDLTMNFIRGAATDPIPFSGDLEVDSETTTALTWSAPVDPNIVSVTGYDVVFGTEPNMLLNPVYNVTTESLPVTLAYDTTYYWRVDSYIVWDSVEVTGVINDMVPGFDWILATLPQDKVPIVTAGSDVLTSLELLPAGVTGTVEDYGEGDITTISWTALPVAPAAAMQMINRTSAAALANLDQIMADPNLLQDWIGTDTREDADDQLPFGDPMVLILKGLPADTYSWTSYHHDPDATFMGLFDATVIDALGSAVTPNVQIGDSNSLPIGTFTTSFTANGTDDVVLVFDQQPYVGLGFNDAWFVMNGFELTGTSGSLNIDFGNVGVASMIGYEAYEASHEQPATFTEQSYSAFGTTVSILPAWGGWATLTDTTNDPSSSSQSATLDTDWPGEYIVTLYAKDNAQQEDSDTLTVRVAPNPCTAAQLSTSWDDFNIADFNEDCVVNLEDFAGIAGEWLDDRNLAGQE